MSHAIADTQKKPPVLSFGPGAQLLDAATIANALGGKRNGKGWMACCPAHNDRNPSLSINDATDGKPLVHCHAGCTKGSVIGALTARGLWGAPRASSSAEAPIYYTYVDASGSPLHRTKRIPGKKFPQEHWDGKRWVDGLGSVTTVLYHLNEIMSRPSETVHIAEGEKDADALRDRGYLATTNPMGSGKGKWKDSYSQSLSARDIALFYDNDNESAHFAGQRHAEEVAKSLFAQGCRIRLIHLTEGCKDISDWFALGHTKAELDGLIENSPYVDCAQNGLRRS